MTTLYFLAAAVALYFIADWILKGIERAAGRRLANRTIIYFFILLALALVTFPLLGRLLSP